MFRQYPATEKNVDFGLVCLSIHGIASLKFVASLVHKKLSGSGYEVWILQQVKAQSVETSEVTRQVQPERHQNKKCIHGLSYIYRQHSQQKHILAILRRQQSPVPCTNTEEAPLASDTVVNVKWSIDDSLNLIDPTTAQVLHNNTLTGLYQHGHE